MKYFRSILTSSLLFTVLIPLLTLAAANTNLENPLQGVGNATDIFSRVASFLASIAGSLALLFTIIGGYTIVSAAGNSERFNSGKKMVLYAIIGMLVTVGSYTILTTTINVLTGAATSDGKLPSFKNKASLIDPLGLTTLPDGGQSASVFIGQRIIGYMTNLLGIAVVLMYFYGGLLWMLSAGREDKITEAKKTLLYATIGAAIVLSSYLLIKFIYTPVINVLR